MDRGASRSGRVVTALDRTDGVCPQCGSDQVVERGSHQPALFFHGGYGATRRTVLRLCLACDWWITSEISEVKPT